MVVNINQAIQILHDATGQLKLTREEHIKIQVSLDVVKELAAQHSARMKEEAAKKPATPAAGQAPAVPAATPTPTPNVNPATTPQATNVNTTPVVPAAPAQPAPVNPVVDKPAENTAQ